MSAYVRTTLEAGPWRRDAGPQSTLREIRASALALANPDFELEFETVTHWLLEVDEATDRVTREIGLDDRDLPVTIAPHAQNAGFWMPGHERLEWRGMIRIDPARFEAAWERFHQGRRPRQ